MVSYFHETLASYQSFWLESSPEFLKFLPQSIESHDHFTSSALIVDASNAHTLLRYHKRVRAWIQPGGHVKNNETLEQACIREVAEETQLSLGNEISWHPLLRCPLHLSIFEVPAFGLQSAHKHYDVCFLLQAKMNVPSSDRLRWFALEDRESIKVHGDFGLMKVLDKFHRLLDIS